MRTLTTLLFLSTLAACGGKDEDGDGYKDDVDCNDLDASVNPDAIEACNGVDDNCDGATDEGVTSTFYADTDSDGFGDPAATQRACDAPTGFVTDDTDCDDGAASTSPGATETCNSVDDNCDGTTDEGVGATFYADADADAYGDASTTIAACEAPTGYITDSGDCDDTSADISPAATEVCNGVDDNCDGTADEGVTTAFYADTDADTYGDATQIVRACTTPAGYANDATDCDDGAATVYPTAPELCDGLDNNCEGAIDEGVGGTYYADADEDGFGDLATAVTACVAPTGYVTDATDCADANGLVNPAATEICDSVDNNCDGAIDEGVLLSLYQDRDGDTYGDPNAPVQACIAGVGLLADATDCDDTTATIHPGAADVCDGADNNCDGAIDEGVTTTYYADADADTYGDANTTTQACEPPVGYVSDITDCNDADAAVSPAAAEVCNTIDDNCDGVIDDADPSVTGTFTFYADTDGDSYGDAAGATTDACLPPTGFVDDITDCNDGDGALHPGAAELWYDGVDQDCAGDDDFDADADGRQSYAHTTTGKDCNDSDAAEFLCGSSMTTALPTCKDIRNVRGGVPSDTYYIDPTGTHVLPVLCDMTTNNGGWTLCGKFDRDNTSTRWLTDPFARAADNEGDLQDATTFAGAQASQDCRDLIRSGAQYILVAGTDTGSLPWSAARITNMFYEVKTDPTNLWDITKDEDPTTVTALNAATMTYSTDITPLQNLGNTDGGNSLGDRCGLLRDGAMWTNKGRNGAAWSNAGKKDVDGVCNDTASDTIYWAWEATDFSVDDHTCGSPVIGTGCGSNAATYRYNLLFMR